MQALRHDGMAALVLVAFPLIRVSIPLPVVGDLNPSFTPHFSSPQTLVTLVTSPLNPPLHLEIEIHRSGQGHHYHYNNNE